VIVISTCEQRLMLGVILLSLALASRMGCKCRGGCIECQHASGCVRCICKAERLRCCLAVHKLRDGCWIPHAPRAI